MKRAPAARYAYRSVLAFGAACAFAWIAGALLPKRHESGASLHLAAPPEAVWNALAQTDAYPHWRRGIAAVEVLGREPWVWKETDARGRAQVHRSEGSEFPGKWVDRFEGGDSPVVGERIFLILPEPDGGTRVALAEKTAIGDPIARFKTFMTGYSDEVEGILADLRKRLAE